MEEYFLEKKFERVDYRARPLPQGEYEQCTFTGCDFSNSELSEIKFISCEFSACNLSLVKLNKTAWREVKFMDCKMLGMHFDHCNDFGFSVGFENCTLNHSSFYKRKMKKTLFSKTALQEVDFSECDLNSVIFDHCDLLNATFDNTNLERADFRTSSHYSIDLDRNKVKKAQFSMNGIIGLLNKYDISIDQ